MLCEDENQRYLRQMILPEFGVDGQLKLKEAKIMVAGIGGLGSVSACYMAAAGIGHLVLVDHDRVALENLNRQILHTTSDLGSYKIESAHRKLSCLNPDIRIDCHAVKISENNADRLATGCHAVLDGTDNFKTRFILNRVCLSNGAPFIYGGINGWTGMVSTFVPGKTACWECLYEDKRDILHTIPAIGPVAGVTACIQGLEALKIILGIKNGLLINQIYYFNALTLHCRKIHIERRSSCRACAPLYKQRL